MPLIRDSMSTSLRTAEKVIKVKDVNSASEILNLITLDNSISYKPKFVDSIKTTNVSNIKVLSTTVGHEVLLVGQTDIIENGLYEQTGTSSTVKQTVSVNTFYTQKDGTDVKATYNTVSDNYVRVYFNSFLFSETLTTNSVASNTLFDIPTIKDKPTLITIEIFGYLADRTNSFHGSYKRSIYNNNGTVIKEGALSSQIIRSGDFLNFDLPSVTFDVASVTTKATLKFASGDDTTTNWFIRGTISL
jgi:hypothetical protein